MKRTVCLLLLLALALSGCSALRGKTEDGRPWDSDRWVSVGPLLGIERSAAGLIYVEKEQASESLSYGIWAAAESEPAGASPAEVYVMAREGAPEDAVSDWKQAAGEYYEMTALPPETVGGQEFELFGLQAKEETPYPCGVLALAVHGEFAVSVELTCRAETYADPVSVMRQYLGAFHYRDLS